MFNQLKEYRNTKETKATYEYLPNNHRYSKIVGSTTTKFLWDSDYVAGELDSTGNISKKYFYGLDMLSDGSGNNYVYDIHGSVINVLNSSGTKTCSYEYNAFGRDEHIKVNSISNQWQYCGEYKDNETGLIYLRNRYYAPETGRFINEDPIRNGGNWYSYASQNPIMFWDPFGLMDVGTLVFNYMKYCVAEYNGNVNGGYTYSELNEVNKNALEMFFSVLFDDISVTGSIYAPSKYYPKSSPNSESACWAACEVYVKNFNNQTLTNVEFNNQIDEMVERVKEREGLENGQGYYVNSLPGSAKHSPLFDTIVNMLDEAGGPIYGSVVESSDDYGVSSQNHAIAIFGAYKYKGVNHILYYDPNEGQVNAVYNDNEMKLNGKILSQISKVDKNNFD